MLKDIVEFLKFGGKGLRNALLCLYSVLTAPTAFFNSLPDDSEEQFVQASIFACFISVLGLLIVLPVQRIFHVQAETMSFVAVDTVITYAFMFVGGSVYHGVAKVFQGHAPYRKTVTTFLYLTAFHPLLGLAALPALVVIQGQVMKDGYPYAPEALEQIALALLDKPISLFSAALCPLFLVWFIVVSAKAFRIVHRVSRAKACCIALFGFAGYQLTTALLELPLVQLFLQAFRSPST